MTDPARRKEIAHLPHEEHLTAYTGYRQGIPRLRTVYEKSEYPERNCARLHSKASPVAMIVWNFRCVGLVRTPPKRATTIDAKQLHLKCNNNDNLQNLLAIN